MFRVFIGDGGSGLRWTWLPRYDDTVVEVSVAASEWFDACVNQLEQGGLYTDCDNGWQWFAEVGPKTEPRCVVGSPASLVR